MLIKSDSKSSPCPSMITVLIQKSFLISSMTLFQDQYPRPPPWIRIITGFDLFPNSLIFIKTPLYLNSFCSGKKAMAYNGSPLAVGGDFEALHCQPAPNLDRSTNLQLTTSPPLAANGCYVMLYFNQVSFLFLSRRLTILFCFLFYCNS